ncbi:trichodiene oxygenase [Xylaria digitata]|nr:trichodiene oxygenase [Xylaria digitata]
MNSTWWFTCPIIRISPHELHINDPAFYNTLYCQEGRWDRYAWAWDAWGAEGLTIHTAEHEHHWARRQPLATFFSRAKVINQQELIRRNVDKLCNHLSRIAESGKMVNLGAAISALARDVSFEYILGRSHSSLDSEDFDVAVLHAAKGAGPLWRITKHVGYVFHIVNTIPVNWMIKISDDNMKTFFAHMKATMKDTKDLMASVSAPTPDNRVQRTIVHEILNSKLPPEDKSFQRVFEDVTSVSGAGLETTGSALRLISTRMARIAPDRDLVYRDYRIPSGTPVGMTTILMHTDEELYPDPQSFNPERWMDHNGRKNAEEAYAPFSRGTRVCLGMHLVWAEMYIVLAALVRRFDFQFVEAKAEDFECISDQFVIGTRGNGPLEARVEMCRK